MKRPTPPGSPAPMAPVPHPTTTLMATGAAGQSLMLLPGQWHVGRQVAQLRTLLGSCVSVTLWHPQRRIGAMCHYLLPSRRRGPNDPMEGRFGDEALELLVNALKRQGTRPEEFEAHLHGGADTMPDNVGTKFNIGERNIEAGWSLLDQYGFALQGVDVGDNVPRTVTLDFATGEVAVRRGAPRNSGAMK